MTSRPPAAEPRAAKRRRAPANPPDGAGAGDDSDGADDAIDAVCRKLVHDAVDARAVPPFRPRVDGEFTSLEAASDAVAKLGEIARRVGQLEEDVHELRSDLYRGGQLTAFLHGDELRAFAAPLRAWVASWQRFAFESRDWVTRVVNAPYPENSALVRIDGPSGSELVLTACNDWTLRYELNFDVRKRHVYCLAALVAAAPAGNAERAAQLAKQPFDKVDRELGFGGNVARNDWVRLVRVFFETHVPQHVLSLGAQFPHPALYWADGAQTRVFAVPSGESGDDGDGDGGERGAK